MHDFFHLVECDWRERLCLCTRLHDRGRKGLAPNAVKFGLIVKDRAALQLLHHRLFCKKVLYTTTASPDCFVQVREIRTSRPFSYLVARAMRRDGKHAAISC